MRADDWTIRIEKQLTFDQAGVATNDLVRLEKNLNEAMRVVPEGSRTRLESLNVFLMYGPEVTGGGRDSGLKCFQKDTPASRPLLDKKLEPLHRYLQCLELRADLGPVGTATLVHELAHTCHLEQWPEDLAEIQAGWENAMKLGLYRKVKDLGVHIVDKAYATIDQLEYCAELSCF